MIPIGNSLPVFYLSEVDMQSELRSRTEFIGEQIFLKEMFYLFHGTLEEFEGGEYVFFSWS